MKLIHKLKMKMMTKAQMRGVHPAKRIQCLQLQVQKYCFKCKIMIFITVEYQHLKLVQILGRDHTRMKEVIDLVIYVDRALQPL